MQQIRSILPDALEWLKQAFRRMDDANVRLYAAAIAYRTIFGLIAFLSTAALVAVLLGVDADDVQQATGAGSLAAGAAAGDLDNIGAEFAASTLESSYLSVWVAGLFGFLFGLWTMSGGFAALCDILDRVHGVHVYRTMTWRYLRGAGRAFIFLIFAALAMVVLVLTTGFGDAVFGTLGLEFVTSAWKLAFRVIVAVLAVLIAFAYVLRYGSHARPPWGQVIPGSIVGAALWLLLLTGFVAYVRFFNGFESYGAIATAIAILFFGYLQGYLVIVLALFRQEVAWVVSLVPGIRRSGDGASIEVYIPGVTDD